MGAGLAFLAKSAILTNSAVADNHATGGAGLSRGRGYGGGPDIDLAAIASLDTFTLKHTKDNRPDEISGPYSLIP